MSAPLIFVKHDTTLYPLLDSSVRPGGTQSIQRQVQQRRVGMLGIVSLFNYFSDWFPGLP